MSIRTGKYIAPKFIVYLISAYIFLISTSNCFAANDALILGIHPYKSATELVDNFTPLASYLSNSLNTEIIIKISKSYADHISRVGNDEYDIAYLGPASYVKLVDEYNIKPLLARLEVNHKPEFRGIIFTRTGSNIRSIQDLKGKQFAFGSKSSTMSYLVPKYVIQQSGLSLDDLAGYDFLGNHNNVALGVLMGKYDAGAVKEAVFEKYEDRGLTLITYTPSLSEHLFVTSNKLSSQMFSTIKELLLKMHNDPKGASALHSIKKTITRIVPVVDHDYDNLREILKQP